MHGFTLDKESNTIAIICQDVTVVLAFDTRERLIQWQVKIANNLGEDEQFLVQISSAPMRAKLSPGPALLHILEYQFCLTVGVPPRLVGCWQISQLRNFTKFDSGRVEGTKVMLDSLDKKEKEQNRASLKRIIDTTIFCGENEIPLRGHWATDGRKPFRKGGQFSSVARVQIKLTSLLDDHVTDRNETPTSDIDLATPSTSSTPCKFKSPLQQEKSSDSILPPPKKRIKQLCLTSTSKSTITEEQLKAFDKNLIHMIALDYQPLSIVEDEGFRLYSKSLKEKLSV
ncbi:Protein Dok-7 [Homalodisca vitripennis]|nr:Protein Dok-7 [Homalodisca vitripennis]